MLQSGRFGKHFVQVRFRSCTEAFVGGLKRRAGWFWDVLNPDPGWLNNDEMGPYDSDKEAWSDVRSSATGSDAMAARKSGKATAPGRPRMAILPGPPADATCSLSRIVQVAGLRLEIWNCSDQRPLIRVKMRPTGFQRGHTRLVARQLRPGTTPTTTGQFHGGERASLEGPSTWSRGRGPR